MKTFIVVAMVALVLGIAVSGCTLPGPAAQGDIKNPEQAKQAIQNVSKDVSDVSSILKDIDSSLGGK